MCARAIGVSGDEGTGRMERWTNAYADSPSAACELRNCRDARPKIVPADEVIGR